MSDRVGTECALRSSGVSEFHAVIHALCPILGFSEKNLLVLTAIGVRSQFSH
jgi:hypothetical protein